MSYLHYLCLFAYSGVQDILCCVFVCLSSSCVTYVASFYGLSIFDCLFSFSNVYSLIVIRCVLLAVSTTTTNCSCNCSPRMTVNSSELQDWIRNITITFTVNKTKLSSYTRRLSSARDSRPSSIALGSLGAILLAIIVIFVISGDVINVVLYLKGVIQHHY